MKENTWFKPIKQVNPPVSEYANKWQEAGLEDTQLKVGNNRDISNSQMFAMYIDSSAGGVWDWTPRDLNLVWFQNNRTRTFTWTLIVWKADITANITKRYTINTPTRSTISIKSGRVARFSVSPTTATQTITVVVTWTYKFVRWSSLSLTSTNNEIAILNTTWWSITFKLQYSTSAWERPTFGILIEII